MVQNQIYHFEREGDAESPPRMLFGFQQYGRRQNTNSSGDIRLEFSQNESFSQVVVA